MLAAPVMAQTNVTSIGREGQTTCIGQIEQNTANMPITALSTTSVTVTAPQITWSQVLAPLGDGQAPSNAQIGIDVVNARTGTPVTGSSGIEGLAGLIDSGTPIYAGGSVTRGNLSEKTLYHMFIYAVPAGRSSQIIARRCFMTGGTYTMTVDPGSGGSTTGCFSINPRTIQDVRNCWCGRQNNLPLFSSTSTPTQAVFRQGIGCR